LKSLQGVTRLILSFGKNGRYCAQVSQSIVANVAPKSVWNEISNIIGLTDWVIDVKKTEFLSKIRCGVGAIRKLTFADGNQVIEYVVGWKPEQYLSYIATSGLPLDAYHATLLITPKGKNSEINWSSFLVSNSDDKKQFEEFLSFIDEFYQKSLQNLKTMLEKQDKQLRSKK
jgi:hypothetical protein